MRDIQLSINGAGQQQGNRAGYGAGKIGDISGAKMLCNQMQED
jgi:hypothetical protein